MNLNNYFEEIESLSFQIQFSVLSGLSVVEFALSHDATVKGLLAELRRAPSLAEELYSRILYLLPKIANETSLSYDESIVAYLYSLEKTDLLLAHRASLTIWSFEGLLWSRWLAYKIMHFVNQIETTLDVSTVDGKNTSIDLIERNELVDSTSYSPTFPFIVQRNQTLPATYSVVVSISS